MGFSQLVMEGFRLHQAGELDQAEELYRQSLKQEDNHFNALQLLGAVALHKGDLQNALSYLNAAVKINPHYSVSLYNLGLTLEKLNELPQALHYYEQAITLDPHYRDAIYNKQLLVQRIALEAAHLEAKTQLKGIENDPQSPFLQHTQSGYKRGISFYSSDDLLTALTNTFYQFYGYFKVYPNLVDPKGFNEKIQWLKFFSPIKFPESGNKLSTSFFIPKHLKSQLRCPKIIWHSRFNKLPSNQMISPGYYYLKANFGSGMFKRIHYPLSKQEFVNLEAECAIWLQKSFGLEDGEWWYNGFTKNIFLEEEILDSNGTISYNFHIANGALLYINLFKKPSPDSGEIPCDTRFDANFRQLPEQDQHPRCSRVNLINLSDAAKDKMVAFAKSIGKNYSYVRIDFLMNGDQDIYLGEITLSPTNGLESRPDSLERLVGEKIVLP